MVALIVTFPPKFPGVSDKPFLAFFVGFVLLVTLIIAVTYYKIFKITSKSIREHSTNSHFAGKVVRLSLVAALYLFIYNNFICLNNKIIIIMIKKSRDNN